MTGVATRVYPHKAREHIEGYREVMLLLNKKHYCWVKNFQRLMCLRVDHGSRRYCHRCTSSFKTTKTSTGEEKLRVHLEQKCTSDQPDDVGPPSLPEDRLITTPDGEKEIVYASMMFTAFELLHDLPLVVYADFETYQSKSGEAGIVLSHG